MLLVGCLDRLFDLDAPGLRRFAPRNSDVQQPVAIPGGDPIRVHVVGQADRPPESAGETLARVNTALVVLLQHAARALPRNGENASIHSHIDLGGIQPWREGIHLDSGGRAADVYGGGRTLRPPPAAARPGPRSHRPPPG